LADGLQWYFELTDRVTGPARRMEKSLSAVSAAAKKVDRATNDVSLLQFGKAIRNVFGSGAEGAFYKGASKLGSMLAKIDEVIPLDVIEKVGPSLLSAAGGMLATVAGVVAAVGVGIAVAVGAAVTGAAALAAFGFKFAAESAEFKRNTLFGLQTMLGTTAEARGVLDELEGWAKQTAMPKDTFTGLARKLLGAGFKRDALAPVLGALSDIQAANGGDAAAADALMSQLVRIKSLDKVQSRELFAFGSMGLAPEKIFGALAEQRHITLKQAKALFDSGNLNADEAMYSILDAIRTNFSGGKLGALGDKYQAGSLTAQLQHMKDAFGDLFENVNTKPLTDFLQRINAGLAGGGAEKIGNTLNKAFAAMAGLFDRVSADDIARTIDVIGKAFDGLVDRTIEFFGAVKEGWDAIKGPLRSLMDSLFKEGGSDDGGAWKKRVTFFIEFAGVVAGIVLLLVKLVMLVNDAVVELMTAGARITDGLWRGIKEGWADMMGKFHGLVEQLPASVKKILGIASPSKVFATLGVQTAQGFQVGLDRVDLTSAMFAAIAPPNLAPFEARGLAVPPSATLHDITAGAYASRSERAITVHLTINVDGSRAHDPHELAEEIKPMAISALTTALEQLAIESGG
jgi:hypothetical protein